MNVLLLPGNSKRSGEWLKQVELELAPAFGRTRRHAYAHWEHDEPEIDLDHEVERLATSVQGLKPYVLFAKSAGTILASKAMAIDALQPVACLFVGFPLAMVTNHDLPADEWLRATNMPITVLQHNADPLGSYQEVAQFFSHTGHAHTSVHKLPGDTHDYLEFQTLKDFTVRLTQ